MERCGKLLALSLVLVLALCLLPMCPAAGGGTFSVTCTARSATDATMELVNETGRPCAVCFVVAAYDEDQRMVACAARDRELEAGGRFPLSVSYAEGRAVTTVRAFVLDAGTHAPLCPAKSVTTAVLPLTAEKEAALHGDLQRAIDAILSSGTGIVRSDTAVPGKTYTGTAYYVSSTDGQPGNDGLSPQQPWSLDEFIRAGWDRIFQPGDAVFFKRGDIFRLSWSLQPETPGVTYSAYGEGPKPILTFSSANGAGPEKWQCCYDRDGVKIWRYADDMLDTGGLVCTTGSTEVIAKRVYEFYDLEKQGYVSCRYEGWSMEGDNFAILEDRLFAPEEALTENHTILSRPPRGDEDGGSSIASGRGPLYFRCDEGDPGEVFSSIEFSEYCICGLVWVGASDLVFDNISFRYTGNSFAKNADNDPNLVNTRFQNCEFAYSLPTVTDYSVGPDHVVGIQSDGVYNIVSNAVYENNYFHDCGVAISMEWAPDRDNVTGDLLVADNVLVNTAGIRLDSTIHDKLLLGTVAIRGNQLWNTGSTDLGYLFYAEGGVFLPPNRYKECIIENNVFYASEKHHPSNALLHPWAYETYFLDQVPGWKLPTLAGNTYVQYAGGDVMAFGMTMEPDGAHWRIDDPGVVDKMSQSLHDTTSECYTLPAL